MSRPSPFGLHLVISERHIVNDAAGDAQLSDLALQQHGCAAGIERDTYSLQIMVAKRVMSNGK